MAYRSSDSYRAKTPEARARQLENLKRGKRPGTRAPSRADLERELQGVDIMEFATSPEYLGLTLYPGQEILLRGLYGLPIPDALMPLYREMTGNEQVFEDGQEKRELAGVIGRRGGKSTTAAIVAIYEGTVRAHVWKSKMPVGELAYIIVICTRQKSAEQIIQSTCARLLANAGSKLRGIIKASWQAELELNTGVVISSFPTNSTAARGLPCPVFILDEVAWFAIEGPRADESIYNAIRPGQAQFGNAAKVLLISSPLSKDGLLWNFYKEGSQVPARLTVRAPTLLMNPNIEKEFIEREYARDPDSAAREYFAEFCERVESLFTDAMLDAAMVLPGNIPYKPKYVYTAGLDASGLAGRDLTAFAIAHREPDDSVVLDYCQSWDSRNADKVFGAIGKIAKIYKISKVYIDRFAAGYVENLLAKEGLKVEIRVKAADIFLTLKSLLVGSKAKLPLNHELRTGLARTQLTISKASNPSIVRERTAGSHGDLADAAATACWAASSQEGRKQVFVATESEDYSPWPGYGHYEPAITPEQYEEMRRRRREAGVISTKNDLPL